MQCCCVSTEARPTYPQAVRYARAMSCVPCVLPVHKRCSCVSTEACPAYPQAVRYSPGDVWMSCGWRLLQAEVGAATRKGLDMAGWAVQLRAPVQQLQEWWKLRLEVGLGPKVLLKYCCQSVVAGIHSHRAHGASLNGYNKQCVGTFSHRIAG